MATKVGKISLNPFSNVSLYSDKPFNNNNNYNYNGILKDEPSCVMKDHRAVTIGTSIKEAFTRMRVLEAGARILFQAKLLGTPQVLTNEESDAILNLDIEQYRKKLLQKSDEE